MDKRPDPEKLLAKAKEEEVTPRGKLKIYLGAAPGVGKTYTMLADASAKRMQGLDVVAGVVESHGRKEIEELLKKVEVLPKYNMEYHGKVLTEFDLDAALARDPGLILIDEMAHTNIPGLRHAKRWQDIKELLNRGIDVYTTLNVQHIESLNDVIAQIIGIKVRETVPDSFLDLAHAIELVDLPPDDLIKRLQEGKIYIPAQVELASQHFFRKSNLTALRELALRVTAERVDKQVQQHRKVEGVEHTWPTTERLLVCIGSSAASAKIVRAASRMASSLRADWIAVHVDVPHLTQQQRNQAIQNLRLAEQQGAETRILSGLDIVSELIHFARDRNVTKIAIGKRARPRWKEIIFGSLVDELVRKSGEIDIYIIRGENNLANVSKSLPAKRQMGWNDYGFSLLIVAVITAINYFLFPMVHFITVFMLYLLSMVLLAMRGKTGPVIFAVLFSMFVCYFLFFIPKINSAIFYLEYIFMVFVMLEVAYLISSLTRINRQQAEIAHLVEQRTSALHTLTQLLASTRGLDKLLEIAINYIATIFNSEVFALLPDNNILKIRASSNPKKVLTAKDQGVAQWVYELGQVAGLGTDTLPFSDAVYVPLLGSQGAVGVLKVHPKVVEKLLIPEQLRLLESCANQVALALEVDRLQEKAKHTQIAIETERLRTALFSSLSHELRHPLSAIVSIINHFIKEKKESIGAAAQDLIQNIAHEAESLNRLINNLLQITQLEEGKIKLKKKAHSLEKIVKLSLARVEKKLADRPCHVHIPSHAPKVFVDKVLLEQVLVNLLENAILYTPAATAIDISASFEEDNVLISVSDSGPGLPVEDIEMIFEKFYRGQKPTAAGGAGLGLTVCQSIIKAHGGRIWAENRWGGGAVFYFVLPLVGEL
jgi:two-component system, OmpR family, sensor histidine kinase KdpD